MPRPGRGAGTGRRRARAGQHEVEIEGCGCHTTQGFMVGDYISTSFLAGQQRVVGGFAIGFAPSSDGLLNEPMYAGLEKVRARVNHTRNNSVLFSGAAATPSTTF